MKPDFYADATRRVMTSLRERGLDAPLRRLHRQRPGRACGLLVLNWSVIFGAFWLAEQTWCMVPLAILLVGWRQRALGNLLHDGSHGALLAGRRANRWVTIVLCGLPMLEDFDEYRSCHQRHHKYLGDPARDPDRLVNAPGVQETALGLYLHHLRSPAMLRTSVLGNFRATPLRGRVMAMLWWGACITLLAHLGDLALGLRFAALFFVARATVYHAIRVFAEMSDHVIPPPSDVLFGGTRTMPGGWLAMLLNPHHDNYHLAHHLFPRVPTFTLDRLDALLMRVPEYGAALRFSSYFVGPHSVVRHWVEGGRS